MLSFLKRKKSTTDQLHQREALETTTLGSEVSFQSDLIEQFYSDHKDLLGLYGDIKTAFMEKDCKQVAIMLKELKYDIQAHLLTENVRLYAYLEQMFKGDEINSEIISEFRKEMNGIAKEVMNFFKKYSAIGDNKALSASFDAEFSAIGKVLVDRMKREEKLLYPLYAPKR
jgi:regulator of sigma D